MEIFLPLANGDPIGLVGRALIKTNAQMVDASREQEIALPNELDTQDHVAIVMKYIEQSNRGKPYQFAIHRSIGKLSQEPNTHVHLLESDRIQDGVERPLDQIFRRFNPEHPELGGCKKGTGGRDPASLRQEVQAKRKLMADIINAKLEEKGYSARVDHRSLKEQGIERAPETSPRPRKSKKHVSRREAGVCEEARTGEIVDGNPVWALHPLHHQSPSESPQGERFSEF